MYIQPIQLFCLDGGYSDLYLFLRVFRTLWLWQAIVSGFYLTLTYWRKRGVPGSMKDRQVTLVSLVGSGWSPPDSCEFTSEFRRRRISDLGLESTSPWSRLDIAELSSRWLEIVGFCIRDYHGNGWREAHYEIINSDTSIVHIGLITLKTSEQKGYMFCDHSWSWEVNRISLHALYMCMVYNCLH